MTATQATTEGRVTASIRSNTSRWRDLAPVAVVLATGAAAIVLGAQQGPRSSVHIILLSAVLVENALALLVRGRHPLMALAGVLATYVLVDNEATTLLPVLLATLTLASARDRGTITRPAVLTAVLVLATPVIHDETGSFLVHTLLPLLALALAVAVGIYRRASQRSAVTAAQPGSDSPACSYGISCRPAQRPPG